MMKLFDKIKGMSSRKAILYMTLISAIAAGTWSNHRGDFVPVNVQKVGSSGGICVGGRIRIEQGAKFYGIAIGGIVENAGEIYGMSIGLGNPAYEGKVFGLEAGIVNVGANAPTLGNTRDGNEIYGVQLGLSNAAKKLRGIQIGLHNTSAPGDENQSAFLIDYNLGEN
jgi:hypothetical protein